MNSFENLAKVVGPIAMPLWDGTCLAWDKRDVVYVKHDGLPYIRIRPTGETDVVLPENVSQTWLSTIGRKCGIEGVYQARNIKHQSHRKVVFNGTRPNMLIGQGEMILKGKLNSLEKQQYPNWYGVSFQLDDAPGPGLTTVDVAKSRKVIAGIRKQWNLHRNTVRMLAEKRPGTSRAIYEYRWNRTLRAKKLLDLDLQGFIDVRFYYETLEAVVKSCNLEIYKLTDCFLPVVESKI